MAAAFRRDTVDDSSRPTAGAVSSAGRLPTTASRTATNRRVPPGRRVAECDRIRAYSPRSVTAIGYRRGPVDRVEVIRVTQALLTDAAPLLAPHARGDPGGDPARARGSPGGWSAPATRTRSGASTSTSPPTTGCSGTPTSRPYTGRRVPVLTTSDLAIEQSTGRDHAEQNTHRYDDPVRLVPGGRLRRHRLGARPARRPAVGLLSAGYKPRASQVCCVGESEARCPLARAGDSPLLTGA